MQPKRLAPCWILEICIFAELITASTLSQKFLMTAQSTLRIAQQVFKAICDALPPHEVFSYNDLQSLSLSAQCRAFIFAELTFSARSLLASLETSRFNLQQDAMREPRHHFANIIVTTATQLPRKDFIQILESALQIEAQYLAQPHRVLKDLIFANRSELSMPDISDRLSNFVEYAYLLDVFKQYLERKQPSTLSAEKFAKVLFEIDTKLCAAYSHDEFMMLFKPLFEFYQRAGEKAVACEALRLFLAEKNLDAHTKRIDLAMQNGIDALTADALNDLLLAPLDVLVPKPELAQSEIPTPKSDITIPKSTIAQSEITKSDITIPKSTITQSEIRNPKSDITIPKSTITQSEIRNPNSELIQPEITNPKSEIANQKSTITQSELTNPQSKIRNLKSEIPTIDFFELEKQRLQSQKVQQEPNLRDVRLLISDDERKKFIKRLFKGSEADYNTAISAINQMKTWREASLYIDREIFSRFKVDEFSSEAVAFVDIVFERFQTR
jgi:hypothetical protein